MVKSHLFSNECYIVIDYWLFWPTVSMEDSMHAKLLLLCPTLCDPMDYSLPASHPWISPGKSTGVVCRVLLQGRFDGEVLT